jgi:hypothetical protein
MGKKKSQKMKLLLISSVQNNQFNFAIIKQVTVHLVDNSIANISLAGSESDGKLAGDDSERHSQMADCRGWIR